MRELIGKLESSSDPSAAALRVIDHFDRLVEERATAATAFRFADRIDGPGASVVRYEALGATATLAERFTPLEAAGVPDVQRLDAALATHPWLVDTLQAALDQTSLRQAASSLHVHHSTLQERLAWLEARLGIALAQPGGRQRAAVALVLWRIAHSEDSHPPE